VTSSKFVESWRLTLRRFRYKAFSVSPTSLLRRFSATLRSICLIVILFIFTTSCTLWQFTPHKKYDAIYEGQNLVPNGDVEILYNEQPVHWNYQGKCAVGLPGFQSDYALTMEVPSQDTWAKWETQVNSIKPHTKYVISFWYRLPEKGRMELLIFGKSLPITQMFRYNPMHWCRYSSIMDSGKFNGKCMISFLAKQGIEPFTNESIIEKTYSSENLP